MREGAQRWDEMTEGGSERPGVEEPRDGRERNRQQTHHDVRDGQISDEHVGDGADRETASN